MTGIQYVQIQEEDLDNTGIYIMMQSINEKYASSDPL